MTALVERVGVCSVKVLRLIISATGQLAESRDTRSGVKALAPTQLSPLKALL